MPWGLGVTLSGVGMHLFVLVVLCACVFYPVAARPALRAGVFCAMIVLYAGAAAAWWNGPECHFNEQPKSGWILSRHSQSQPQISCKGVQAMPDMPASLITAALR